MALKAPSPTFNTFKLEVHELDPEVLIRVSSHDSGEPYFGRSGGNRFDDHSRAARSRFGTCYFGLTLEVGFAETVLHDETLASDGHYYVSVDVLTSRYVARFNGSRLRLANLTGAALKRLGGDAAISSEIPYDMPQHWSMEVHAHPQRVDGFVYMSRHINNAYSVVLYHRCQRKLHALTYTPLLDYPGTARAIIDLSVRWV